MHSRSHSESTPWRQVAGWYGIAILLVCTLVLPQLLQLLAGMGVLPLSWASGPGMILLGSLLPGVLLLWCAVHGAPSEQPRGMWLRLGLAGFRWRHLGTGLKWFPVVYIGNAVIQAVWQLCCDRLGISYDVPPTLQVAGMSEWHFLALAASAVLLAPWIEEILLREWLFGSLLPAVGFWWAALAASAFFAVLHMTLLQFPCLLFLGLFLQLLYWHTGSLWPCIWVHMLNNLTSIVLLQVFRLAGVEF